MQLKKYTILLFYIAILSCSKDKIDIASEYKEQQEQEQQENEDILDTINDDLPKPNIDTLPDPSGIDTEIPTIVSSTAPSKVLDMSHWYLSVPTDNGKGVATSISKNHLMDGYTHSKFFFVNENDPQGVVFKNTPYGAYKTSVNTKYSRVELRELMSNDSSLDKKGVNANNWVFGSSSQEVKEKAGGVDGKMTATLAVNRVTTTNTLGTSFGETQQGRIIIGQIHGSDNEPIRLYYHKKANHSKGAIYFVHQHFDGSNMYYNLIGDYLEGNSSNYYYTGVNEPEDGIALNEKFSYNIEVIYDTLYVTISREGKADVRKTISMSNSGYGDDWMYFKAGLYSMNNNTESTEDYDQVTFYKLDITH